MEVLFSTRRIEVRKSPIHGWGVFAKENIEANTILEQSHGLFIPRGVYENIQHPSIKCNGFAFPRDAAHTKVIIPFGLGCVYNSLPASKCNADWYCDLINNIIIYHTTKEIKKDEEIFIDYFEEMEGWEQIGNKI